MKSFQMGYFKAKQTASHSSRVGKAMSFCLSRPGLKIGSTIRGGVTAFRNRSPFSDLRLWTWEFADGDELYDLPADDANKMT